MAEKTPTTNPAPTVRLRNLQPAVIGGTDDATLLAALQAYFTDPARGDAVLVAPPIRVADYKVLLLYAE